MTAMEQADPGITGYQGPWVIRHTGWVVVVGSVGALVLLVVALEHPELFAKGLSRQLGAKERADVLGSGRDFGLKLVAAIGALTAGILGWGRLELAKEEREVARHTLDAQRRTLDAQRQTVDAQRLTGDAERFARAVDQMGSEKDDVVLGGLYALEALANSAEGYQSQVTEVLSAFVRQHARNRDTPSSSGEPLTRDLTVTEQGALTILGRNPSWSGRVDLSDADLRGAKLAGADLTGADLEDTKLQGAFLSGARLSGANLLGVDLSHAFLSDAYLCNAKINSADLTGAFLLKADLTGSEFNSTFLTSADLTGASFSHADLSYTKLTGADIQKANLTGANLTSADLTGANLSGADLLGAKWATDRSPIWPSGFEPPLTTQHGNVSIIDAQT